MAHLLKGHIKKLDQDQDGEVMIRFVFPLLHRDVAFEVGKLTQQTLGVLVMTQAELNEYIATMETDKKKKGA